MAAATAAAPAAIGGGVVGGGGSASSAVGLAAPVAVVMANDAPGAFEMAGQT